MSGGSLGSFIGQALYKYEFENLATGGAALRCTPTKEALCRTDPETQNLDCSDYEKSASSAYSVFHYHIGGKPYRCIVDSGQPEDQDPLTNDCDGLSHSALACKAKEYKGKQLCTWGQKNLYARADSAVEAEYESAGLNVPAFPTFAECANIRRLRYEEQVKALSQAANKGNKEGNSETTASESAPDPSRVNPGANTNDPNNKSKDDVTELDLRKELDLLDAQWEKCREGQGFVDAPVYVKNDNGIVARFGKMASSVWNNTFGYKEPKWKQQWTEDSGHTAQEPQSDNGYTETFSHKCQSVCTTQTWEDCDPLICLVDPKLHRCKPRLFPVLSPARVPGGSTLGVGEEDFTRDEAVFLNTTMLGFPKGTKGQVLGVQQIQDATTNEDKEEALLVGKEDKAKSLAAKINFNKKADNLLTPSNWDSMTGKQYLIMLQQAGERFDRKLQTYLTGQTQPPRLITSDGHVVSDPQDFLFKNFEFPAKPKRLAPDAALLLAFADMKAYIKKRRRIIDYVMRARRARMGEDKAEKVGPPGSNEGNILNETLKGSFTDQMFRMFGFTGDANEPKKVGVVTPENRKVMVRFLQDDLPLKARMANYLGRDTVLAIPAKNLSRANEAVIRYKSDRHIARSSLIENPFLYSCGWVGTQGKKRPGGKVREDSDIEDNWSAKSMHPEIVMREPFTWMRVKLSDVDNPSDVRWNGVFTFPKPVYRLSAYARANPGATAHFYDPDFFHFPYVPNMIQKFLGYKGMNQAASQNSWYLGRLFAKMTNMAGSVAASSSNKPRASAMHMKFNYSPKEWMKALFSRNQLLAPHQQIVPFKPICGPMDSGKRRLFDLSVVTDGMLSLGGSSPGYEPSLREFYTFVKGTAYLDMTKRTGAAAGLKAKLATDEIDAARSNMKGAMGAGVKKPNEINYTEYDKNKAIQVSKPSVFEMLTDSPALLPSAIRKKLKDTDFWSESQTAQTNYPILNGDNDDEPFYYGDHVGIEVSTPRKISRTAPRITDWSDETSHDIAKFFPTVMDKALKHPRGGLSDKDIAPLERAVMEVYPLMREKMSEPVKISEIGENPEKNGSEGTANEYFSGGPKNPDQDKFAKAGLYFPSSIPAETDIDRVSLTRMDSTFRDVITLNAEDFDKEELDPSLQDKFYVGKQMPPPVMPAWKDEQLTGFPVLDRLLNKKMATIWKQM